MWTTISTTHDMTPTLVNPSLAAVAGQGWVFETLAWPALVIGAHVCLAASLHLLYMGGRVGVFVYRRWRRRVDVLAGAALIIAALWPFLWAHAPGLAVGMVALVALLLAAGARRAHSMSSGMANVTSAP